MSFVGTKILITGKMAPEGLAYLKKGKGLSVEYAPGLSGPKMMTAIKDFNALIIRTETPVTRELLSHGPKLELICRAGIGVDHIDLRACAERQIVVMNTPGANRVSTAEHALALLLALARSIPQCTQMLKQGRWDQERFTGTEIAQKTLAIIGLGNIGQRLATRAKALGMDIVAYDPYLDPSIASVVGARLMPLSDALCKAQFVSVHVPLTQETAHLVNQGFISQMMKGSYFINTSRGKVVDERALALALAENYLKGAALDVFDSEPLSPDSPLLALENIILTPHIAGKTFESLQAMSMDAAQQVREFYEEGTVVNAVIKF